MPEFVRIGRLASTDGPIIRHMTMPDRYLIFYEATEDEITPRATAALRINQGSAWVLQTR
jgi:hypothetical protein